MTSLSHVNMAPASSAEHSASESEVRIPLRDAFLSGTLDVPMGRLASSSSRMERAAALAREWFAKHLQAVAVAVV